MKIAYMVDTFPRWSERFIAREITELIRLGADITIFCLKEGHPFPKDFDPDFSGLNERVAILPHTTLPTISLPDGFGEEFSNRFHIARHGTGFALHTKIEAVSALAETLKSGVFDRIHAHFGSLPSTLAWIAAGEAGIPFTFSVHAHDLYVDPQILNEKISTAERVFICHRHAKEYVLENYPQPDLDKDGNVVTEPDAPEKPASEMTVDEKVEAMMKAKAGRRTTVHIAQHNQEHKLTLMRHGLPLEQYPFEQRQPKTNAGPPVVLAAGRFVPKKGFDVLLDAVQMNLLAKMPVHVILVGEGPEEKHLRHKASDIGVDGLIEFRPPVTSTELRQLMRKADLLAMPNRTCGDGDRDGISNVLLEAFALGLPVVCSPGGSLGEAVNDSVAATAPPDNAILFAKAMGAVFHDWQRALDRTALARAHVEEHYDIRKTIAPMSTLFGLGT